MQQIYSLRVIKYSLLHCLLLVSSASFAQSPGEKTRVLVNYLINHRFDSIYNCFSEELKNNFSVNNLALTWNEFERQGGGVVKSEEPRADFVMGNEAWFTQIVFAKFSYDLVFRFDSIGKLEGFRITLPAPPCVYKDPSYSKGVYAYKEIKTFVVCGKYKLPAVLTLPSSQTKVSVIIMVHGSGPGDKDETVGNYKPFRDIALGLAAKGIASLRYEKRTRVYGDKIGPDPESFTVKEEVMDDALAAIALAAAQPEIDAKKVFLLGHSLGAMLAPRIAKQTNLLSGIIMLAANARPLQNIVMDQYEYLMGTDTTHGEAEKKEMLANIKDQVNQLKDTLAVKNMSSEDLLLKLPAPYWLDLLNYNQVETAKSLSIPLLLVQGGRDYQVMPGELEIWKKELRKKKRVSFLFFADLNHLMVKGAGKPSPAEYRNTTGNVPEELIVELTRWVNRKK